ncbi:MurR/RpiR family transcriptional regulator [Mammaliicoccus lentus]|uniref:MurR/RpiR family transcriptional regulator n=1 Tax=Mammaliicoccus lentus TaxID=42858 RepID=A0AAX3W875_MAMLE|nr:MurR/RpiR family transcriptional regulator [Mammaliicoccus lentus]HBV04702.1 MurR/RpiR family transcriptional regulator [Staphylococcus sp.]MBW0766304.1 MurR/RpiR family transcriptional regulator [Mammaliicoccus lentus]MCR1872160.1 MurR/RpiR family transcriptional regulator [Mammaliicoccus lentus]MDQ7142539.1 MurR/RpiR family transcriptional regulator [Mammaliicoccus lentus]MEB5685238.1 MurR/RpiR family transcriptional regulator [Mammaliicoccus lentus]
MEQNALIGRLQKKRNDLSELEKRVLDFILNDYELIANLSIDDIANKSFVSTATVSRCSQKLGYEGYRELKYALIQNQSKLESNNVVQSFSTEIHDFMIENINNLQRTIDDINIDDLEKTVSYISNAQVIEIISVGASLVNGLDLSRKLTFLGKIAHARTDWDELDAITHNLNADSLAICISSSGETSHMINYAKKLKSNHVPIVSIVSNRNSQLAQLSTVALIAKTNNIYIGNVDLSSRHATIFIIDLILMMYGKQL